MLSTEEKKIRLEELLARVRRNRSRLAAPNEERTEEMEAKPALPIPIEPKPVRRISSIPQTIPLPIVTPMESPMEPEPVARESLEAEPEPVVAKTVLPKLVPTPRPEPVLASSAPSSASVPTQKPEPALAASIPAALPKLVLEPRPAEPVPMPAPAATIPPKPVPSIAEESPRIFEAKVEASSPIATVHGQAERAWTLHAVLERAWRLGQTDLDNN